MIELRSLQKSLLLPHIVTGGIAVDFTMGNGNDTLWLSQQVGAQGHVFSFDIQADAVKNTKTLLDSKGKYNNYTLINDSHSNCERYISKPYCVGIFNLGWLPGGDRSITTKRSTTAPAVKSAIQLLAPGGSITVAIYPGHEEGRLEGEVLQKSLESYDNRNISVTKIRIINAPGAPYFFLIEKKL